MPLLSVLTAAVGEWAGYVGEAGDSLAGQELPDGWELEWVVQEDGPNPTLANLTERYPFARYQANGERLGIAATRNLALARVDGELVRALDCDDLVLPGGLAVVVEAFQAHPEIHWVAARADNLLPDDTRVAFEPVSPTGYVEAGAVNEFILEHGYAGFLPHGLTLRTATVRALGGWVATPHGEDIALLVAIAEIAPGYHTPEVVWLYRQHDRQTTRQRNWISFYPVSRGMVEQRINAVREVGLRIGAA